MKTHDMILLTFPPPHPRQCWSPNNRKDDITIQHCFGKRGGERVEFFPFKLLLEVFLNNFFKIAAFSNIPCALQKHTEVIKRICGSPRIGGVTITSL